METNQTNERDIMQPLVQVQHVPTTHMQLLVDPLPDEVCESGETDRVCLSSSQALEPGSASRVGDRTSASIHVSRLARVARVGPLSAKEIIPQHGALPHAGHGVRGARCVRCARVPLRGWENSSRLRRLSLRADGGFHVAWLA